MSELFAHWDAELFAWFVLTALTLIAVLTLGAVRWAIRHLL